MVKLPTVDLQRRGQRLRVDAYEYSRNIQYYVNKGYKLVGEQRGDATPEQQKASNREVKIDRALKRSPEREKQFGDKQRARDANKVTVTATPKVEPAAPESKINPDWSKLPWFKRRAYVKEITGTSPTSVKEAEELMAGK